MSERGALRSTLAGISRDISAEATANSDAVREVVSEIAEEEYDAQSLKSLQSHTEKGQTHG